MNIDLTKLITNQIEYLEIDIDVEFPKNYFESAQIRRLENTAFTGEIVKLYDGNYQIEGILKGQMILPDNITLEDVNYKFQTEISEEFSDFDEKNDNNLKIVKNRLDITEFLWQNILVEIPLKVVNKKNENLTLKGNGWRLVTEDEIHCNNSPFSDLKDKLSSRKE